MTVDTPLIVFSQLLLPRPSDSWSPTSLWIQSPALEWIQGVVDTAVIFEVDLPLTHSDCWHVWIIAGVASTARANTAPPGLQSGLTQGGIRGRQHRPPARSLHIKAMERPYVHAMEATLLSIHTDPTAVDPTPQPTVRLGVGWSGRSDYQCCTALTLFGMSRVIFACWLMRRCS